MDYFSVIVLIVVIFIFISDRNVKSIDKIKSEKSNLNIQFEIQKIKSNMQIIKLEEKNMHHEKILQAINNTNEYVLIQNEKININTQDFDTLIANYINSEKKPCGFNLLYGYSDKKWSLKKIYIDIINYLNIFNKKELTTFGVIICNIQDLKQNEKELKNSLITYTPTQITSIQYNNEQMESIDLKGEYIKKITNSNLDIIIKILLLIISGSIITTNLIYYIFNVNNNINGLIISIVIYYCYSYIIRYIYKPIGKQRLIASYIFPVYFIAYILVGLYVVFLKVINKVNES